MFPELFSGVLSNWTFDDCGSAAFLWLVANSQYISRRSQSARRTIFIIESCRSATQNSHDIITGGDGEGSREGGRQCRRFLECHSQTRQEFANVDSRQAAIANRDDVVSTSVGGRQLSEKVHVVGVGIVERTGDLLVIVEI